MDSARHEAVRRHRRRQRARGVVRVEVQVLASDAALIREVAAALRGDPEPARQLREFLRAALRPPRGTLLDRLCCDLPDAVMDEVLARPRDLPRDVSL